MQRNTSKIDKVGLVKRYQDENKDTDIYFSLTSAIDLLLHKKVNRLYLVSFGPKKPVFNFRAYHIHNNKEIEYFEPFQPFALDSILISAKNNRTIDPFNGLVDVAHETISTTSDPNELFLSRPNLIVRLAALVAETGFSVPNEVFAAAKDNADKIDSVRGYYVWKELKRIIRSKRPSVGINFLRKCEALKYVLPELDNCFGVKQNEKYHKYTVYQHCLYACDGCRSNNVLLKLAALIHDVGKPLVAATNENGITFPKHEVAGTKLARKVVSRLMLGEKQASIVVNLVKYHMYMYDRNWKDSTIRRFIRNVGLTRRYANMLSEFPLFKLRQADRIGRGLVPVTRKQKDFEKRLRDMLLNGKF